MIASRLAKVALLGASALFFLIVVLNNAVFDYISNYEFVRHVLSMDTVFSGDAQLWRALPDPTPEDRSYWLHHAFYWSIIAWEITAGVLCALGAWKLWTKRHAPAAEFQRAKTLAICGLTLTLLQWFTAFITVGAEWFLMWQSRTWNGQEAAGRMFMVFGLILIFVSMRDDEPEIAG
ncbi:membrane protein [Opitutaceae bacterium TAV5]|nr:membrane protein [Opitutaceae bacterium TAV5]